MTRKEAYDYGVDTLEAEGIENAQWDVRILLEDLCGIDREELFLHGDKIISRTDTEKFKNAINFILPSKLCITLSRDANSLRLNASLKCTLFSL